MFQFELHPHIGEICTDILVYEKGGVIKYVKAPAGANSEKVKCVIMWNRVQYFFENWNDSCMSVLVRVTWFGISLYQRGPVLVSAHPPPKICLK